MSEEYRMYLYDNATATCIIGARMPLVFVLLLGYEPI